MIIIKYLYSLALFVRDVVVNCLAAISHTVTSMADTRSRRKSKESQQIAHLYYRVEALSEESAALKSRQAEENAAMAVEMLGVEELQKLQNAVSAAKLGASSEQLIDQYSLSDAEADLIDSIHGASTTSKGNTIH